MCRITSNIFFYLEHAYTITKVVQISNAIKLFRIRNPYGYSYEWKGAWSDNSKELKSLSEDEKAKHGIVREKDGEFFMSVEDFQKHFETLQICNLSQASLDDSDPR